MKFTKLIILFSLSLVVLSCSKDDDGGTPVFEYNKNNLVGTYNLTYFHSEEVETIDVNGFDVVTTTISDGDTFNVTAVFAADNTLTIDGTYRINVTVEQGGQTTNNALIIDLDNEVSEYSVNAAASELTLDTLTFNVSNFSPTGFHITRSETTTEPNGDNTVTFLEMRFSK